MKLAAIFSTKELSVQTLPTEAPQIPRNMHNKILQDFTGKQTGVCLDMGVILTQCISVTR